MSNITAKPRTQASDDGQEPKNMILVMGVTGAGKSYLINTLLGRNEVETGHSLNSCTETCQIVPAKILGCTTALVDTPGFDDTNRSDADILHEISRLLSAQYQLGLRLLGIIYLHRITDVRYQGSALKTFKMLQEICGDEAMPNVFLVTTRWQEVSPEYGAAREWQLRDQFWSYMLQRGSQMARFEGDRDSASAICGQLLGKQEVVLKIQHELVDEEKPLNQTSAGSIVNDDISELRNKYVDLLKQLEEARQATRKSDKRMQKSIRDENSQTQAALTKLGDDEEKLQRRVGTEVKDEIQKAKPAGWRKHVTVPGIFRIFLAIVGLGSVVARTVSFDQM